MTNQTDREFISHPESWNVFVGGITPQEFCKGFESAESAVDDFLNNFPFDEKIPAWLRTSLLDYIEKTNND